MAFDNHILKKQKKFYVSKKSETTHEKHGNPHIVCIKNNENQSSYIYLYSLSLYYELNYRKCSFINAAIQRDESVR